MSTLDPWQKHDILGKWGEDHALAYLLKAGYTLKCRNFRFNRMEIDLIMTDHSSLVMIEVKTRQSDLMGEPWRAVNWSKQRQIVRVANYYSKSIQWPNEVRFDIISIVHNQDGTELKHIKNAFSPRP